MQQTFKAEIDSLAVNKKDEVKITLVTDVANINLNTLQMIKTIGTADVTLDNRQLELLKGDDHSDDLFPKMIKEELSDRPPFEENEEVEE